MGRIFLAAAFGLLTLAAFSAGAQAQNSSPSGPAYLLRFMFKVGDVYTYTISADTTTTFEPEKAASAALIAKLPSSKVTHTDCTSTWTVLNVSTDGKAQMQNTVTIQDQTTDGKDTTAAAQAAFAALSPPVVDMSPTGRTEPEASASSYAGEAAIGKVGMSSLDFYICRFPMVDAEVQQGAYWTAPATSPGIETTARTTFAASEAAPSGRLVRLITRLSGAQDMTGGVAGQPKKTIKQTVDVLFNADHGELESSISYTEVALIVPSKKATHATLFTVHSIDKLQATRTTAAAPAGAPVSPVDYSGGGR